MEATEKRRLLELAAKAAGKDIDQDRYDEDWGFAIRHSSKWWAPHLDDGDSRRLEVALGITPHFYRDHRTTYVATDDVDNPEGFDCIEPWGDDPAAATRLAVLRAAAAIGEDMP